MSAASARARSNFSMSPSIFRPWWRVQSRRAHRCSGSEFVVRLPLMETTAMATPVDAPAAVECAPPPQRRVLLVDDNRDLAESLAALLRLSGHDVAIASDGPAALRIVESVQPDVALI